MLSNEPKIIVDWRRGGLRRPPTLTREIVLAALPGPKRKPIGTIRVHIRLLGQGLNVRQHSVNAMLRKMFAVGLVLKEKKGRWCVWRKAPTPVDPEDPNRRRTEAMLARWRDPEFRQRRREAMLGQWRDPGFRQRQRDSVRKSRPAEQGAE